MFIKLFRDIAFSLSLYLSVSLSLSLSHTHTHTPPCLQGVDQELNVDQRKAEVLKDIAQHKQQIKEAKGIYINDIIDFLGKPQIKVPLLQVRPLRPSPPPPSSLVVIETFFL